MFQQNNDFEEKLQNCKHQNVFEGICMDCRLHMISCGMHIDNEEDFSTSHMRKNNKKLPSFERDLMNSDFPDEVKKWVYNTYNSEKTRVGGKEAILFAYIYLAHLQLELDFKPENIASKLNTTKKQVKDGMKIASGMTSKILHAKNVNSIIAPLVVITPLIFIDDQLKQLDLFKYSDLIKEFTAKILKLNSLLYEEKPNLMSLAFIKYYFTKYHPDILGKTKIHILFKVSLSNLEGCLKQIVYTIDKSHPATKEES